MVAFVGTIVAGLGFMFLISQGIGACPMVAGAGVSCTIPQEFEGLAFYLATAGSAILILGVWRTGIGKERIVSDGTGLVMAIGLTVWALGLFVSSILPFVSVTSAGIGYVFGLLGGALLMGGMVKMRAGLRRVSSSVAAVKGVRNS